jgi:hypothetical protein
MYQPCTYSKQFLQPVTLLSVMVLGVDACLVLVDSIGAVVVVDAIDAQPAST